MANKIAFIDYSNYLNLTTTMKSILKFKRLMVVKYSQWCTRIQENTTEVITDYDG